MDKRLVVWSGGYDSTLVLWNELIKNKEAHAISFLLPNVSSMKQSSEMVCRERFKDRAIENGFKLHHKTVAITYDDFMIQDIGIYPLQMLWLMLGMWMASAKTTLIYGYVKRDDFWMNEDKFMSLIKHINDIMDKKIEIEFPLRETSKYEIYKNIYGLKLEDCVWTCEIPASPMVPCGKCESCIKLELAKKEIEIRGVSLNRYDEVTPKYEITPKDEVKACT